MKRDVAQTLLSAASTLVSTHWRTPHMFPLVLVTLFAAAAPAFPQRHDDRDWRVRDEETITRAFDTSGPQKLLVDNVSGYVHVTGYSGREIRVNVRKRIGAGSAEALQEAKRDVKLDLSQQGNFVRLYVDGPFRTHDGVNYRGGDYYNYRVTFDYDIQVPAAAELVLKTVSHGDIQVRKTTGPFEIQGVNGGIDMQEVAGAGSIRTVNGPVKVAFTQNPARATEFRTVNGAIDVYFQPSLDADLNIRTVNGGVWTDFDLTTRPVAAAGENVNGRFVYRSGNRSLAARAGRGGPELTFHGVNGAIRLHSKPL